MHTLRKGKRRMFLRFMSGLRGWHVMLMSMLIYVLCLYHDGYRLDSTPNQSADPLALLLVGWLGFTDGHYSWFANPLLFLPKADTGAAMQGLNIVSTYFNFLDSKPKCGLFPVRSSWIN